MYKKHADFLVGSGTGGKVILNPAFRGALNTHIRTLSTITVNVIHPIYLYLRE